MAEKKFGYRILYIQDGARNKLMNLLKRHLPKGRGEAFYPCMEYYRRGDKEVKIRPMFPGYVFLYTDLNMKEVHSLIWFHRQELFASTRELALAQERASDIGVLLKADNHEIFELSDVSSDEAEFLDPLREAGGLLAMSGGYEISKNRYMVMEGPLKYYADKIIDVDKHNRKAFLKFEVNGRHAQAGFNCYPRAHYYPKNDSKIVMLSDGTEVDLSELKKKMNSL